MLKAIFVKYVCSNVAQYVCSIYVQFWNNRIYQE